MRVIVTVVIRINVMANLKMEDSVAVQSETSETPDCLVHMWQLCVARARAGRRPATPREGWLEKRVPAKTALQREGSEAM